MKARSGGSVRLAFLASWASSAFLLGLGFGLAGIWYGEIGVFLASLAWILARNKLPGPCLVLSVTVAAAGILVGASALPMIIGSALSLAAWETARQEGTAFGGAPLDRAQAAAGLYAARRLRALIISLGGGLSLVILGRTLSLRLPFFLLVLFAILVFVGLDRVRHYLERGRR